MSDILVTLVADAERQTERRRAVRPETELVVLAAAAPPPRDFAAALRQPGLGVIAEMKPRSPSKGPLTDDYRPAELARAYQGGGACALSVLTHEDGFGGTPDHLVAARDASDVPVLRKDFIVDEYQILEARALGADALLLIVAALTPERLAELLAYTRKYGMEALVEVHDEGEVDTALAAGADVIGVNHRDLRDFSIDRTLSARLRERVGGRRVMVGESGVRGAPDARDLERAGVDAVLVGELLMRAGDPGATIKELIG
ncbi:indole-3-glycerol phosphate synthase TrpC [Streptomyces sp. NRRL S-474]|uniref:indole-3-glycerol phosphate synthase TrpC n=1 Tax=Streptomyces sp. NRRL S-474 TaxID=1463909 RepID=UPI0004C86D24|nr:indole-3-glycerol phosphate synthase TrpC [Streptomyces sp. NRRL S-474]